jgi:CRP/FNR family cyclic AMP-dependent transcriptional regulator
MDKPSLATFAPGEYLVREKAACTAIYIIQEGQLEVYKLKSSGEKIPIGIISSGQYVGEMALLLGTPHLSSVVALSPVQALKISKASIEGQLKEIPPWLLALAKGLAERLNMANDTLRRNGWVDESLSERMKAVEQKFKKDVK